MKKVVSIFTSVIMIFTMFTFIQPAASQVYTSQEVVEELDQSIKQLERLDINDDVTSIRDQVQEYVDNTIQGQGDIELAINKLNRVLELFQDFDYDTRLSIIPLMSDVIIALSGPETIYSMDAGGYIVTYGMRKEPIYNITFLASHNSNANNDDDDITIIPYTSLELNHDISIPKQMDAGIRRISVDLGINYQLQHNGLGVGSTAVTLRKIAEWAQEHPTQLVKINIGDVRVGSEEGAADYLNEQIKEEGLYKYVFNWVDEGDSGYCFGDYNNFTMEDILKTGKNIIFNNCVKGEKPDDIVPTYTGPSFAGTDSGYFKSFDYDNHNNQSYEHAEHLEEHSLHKFLWDPDTIAKQHFEANRNMGMGYSPEGKTAGDSYKSKKNNAGQRIYQFMKAWENMFDDMGIPRAINKLSLEFVEEQGARDVSAVDAVNRLQYERFGYQWDECPLFWEIEPFEKDDDVVDIIRGNSSIDCLDNGFASDGIPAIKAEVDAVLQSVDDEEDMGTSASQGMIQADGYKSFEDWKTVPEFAFDGDLATRWIETGGDDHWIQIDLGSEYDMNAIAIAWDYANHVPRYDVEVSSDGTNWTRVLYIREDNSIDSLHRFWDLRYFTQQEARFVRVEVKDVSDTHPASMWEMKLYNIPLNKIKDVHKYEGDPNKFLITEDTYVRRGSDYWRYNYGTAGADNEIVIKDSNSVKYERMGYLKADISDYEGNVNSAKLKFYVNSVEKSSKVKVRVFGLKSDEAFEWSEYELTEEKADFDLDHYEDVGSVSIRGTGWYEVILDADYIQDIMNNHGQLTFLLRDRENKKVAKRLSTSEERGREPYLIIE